MTRREALATLGKSSLALLFAARRRAEGMAAEGKIMATPDFIGKFTANNPGIMTLQGTNQYVVGRENVVVIDVALSADSNLDGIIEQVEAMGAKKIDKILLTHIHSDHCGGALALRKRCGAKLGIHRSRKGYLGGEDFQYDDNDRISFGDGELNVLHTPGHESGHCCFYESDERILFSGDNILGYGTAVIHPPDGNMTDYLKSLERLLGFDISLILPGHGPLVGKPEAKIREYIKHRLEREQQVIAALHQGRETIGDVTQTIYVDVSPALRRVAEFSVQAHLEKLMREGRVKQEGTHYRLVSEN
ncbi:MAG TPA: MBL fold metallo-hydrolase [Candidatus Binatia bacterium]|jgi:glyoxylase-like metal-dependent hydrolase (beta-lactamase superfamily II)|nr:MBL fold metallo-hydrolase [Candidatus Binatia bacterium]